MNQGDILKYIERYTQRFSAHGYSSETLGWGKFGKQDIRFGVLSGNAIVDQNASVLDVGCGFADLYKFMKSHGWAGKYTGIDIVPVLIEQAAVMHPDANLIVGDFDQLELAPHDYVIGSGIFNARLLNEPMEKYITDAINRMMSLANKAVCVDFLSSYVDFEKEGSWHTSPEWAYGMARKLSRRVMLRSDYLPYEFTLIIFKDDQIGENNTFEAYSK
jgi:SAM-dependent methyltransferase